MKFILMILVLTFSVSYAMAETDCPQQLKQAAYAFATQAGDRCPFPKDSDIRKISQNDYIVYLCDGMPGTDGVEITVGNSCDVQSIHFQN